jgi:hypothetical protein
MNSYLNGLRPAPPQHVEGGRQEAGPGQVGSGQSPLHHRADHLVQHSVEGELATRPVHLTQMGLASSSTTKAAPMPASMYCQRPVVAVASASLDSRAATVSSRTPTRALSRMLSAIKSLKSNIRKIQKV